MRPDLIMLSTCMQGQTGPNAIYPGLRPTDGRAVGLLLHLRLRPAAACAPPYGAYTDFIAPRFSACALIAALDYRRRTGKGQYIDMAQYEAALHNLAPALIDYFRDRPRAWAAGNASDRYAPHGAYRCADEDGHERWIAIAVANDEEWRAMLDRLGIRFQRRALCDRSSRASRIARRSIDSSARCTRPQRRRSDREAAGRRRRRVSGAELHGYPSRREPRGVRLLALARTQGHGAVAVRRTRASHEPHAGQAARGGAVLGQHNDEVLSGMLGLSADEIEQLKQENVIF